MGINKKFQEILNLLPVSKDIKKELVVRINELVDDLKGGGGDDPTPTNGIVVNSIYASINGGYPQKIETIVDNEDYITCKILINENDTVSSITLCELDTIPESPECSIIQVMPKGFGFAVIVANVIYKGVHKEQLLIEIVSNE